MKTALISGCSSGIGHATATFLSEQGWHVLAGVRSAGDAPRGPSIQEVLLDVTRPQTFSFLSEVPRLDALVNNAGVAPAGSWEDVDMVDVRAAFDVNVHGLLELTRACLPRLRASRGRIVNIGSISGRVALPMVGPYSATKFALESISDSLRRELAPEISVTILELGLIRTPIWSKDTLPTPSERYKRADALTREFAANALQTSVPAEAVAKLIHKVLEARRPPARKTLGADTALTTWLATRMPVGWVDAVIRRKS